MYLFLSNLSLSDIGFISTTVPKMLMNNQLQSKVISYRGCLAQMSLFLIFRCMDDMLLTVMAYDRFVAICHQLQYHVIMNPRLCFFLVMLSLLFSLVESQLHNLIILHFSYFENMNISNIFCEPSQLLNLTCFDDFIKHIVTYAVGTIYGFLPLSGIVFSYYKIVSSILKFPSSSGKHKAWSTCGSHLSVVCLFYGTAVGVYLTSSALHSPMKISLASMMYAVVIPMLNPFIYSLRNKDTKHALRRLQSRRM
ncbi:putative gustatory receptor clone PTE01 [Octodon degus]|uniref:Gustatory receptor clone PTE01 n=1 Tax=Octodon degus TaxID=10160 RepID=A0A6P6EJQ9_OCTDE|nr:putative gustatory receptor clone PTE01 [Octodon degus]